MTKSEHKTLDRLWKKRIKERDICCRRPNCPYCANAIGIKYLTPHHIVSRTCHPLKYDLKNGILLCRGSHSMWAHCEDPFVRREVDTFYERFADMEYLQLKRHSQSKNDYNLIKLYLEEQCQK
jgi:5-methylcytosine-specific restriction endonuclease McrA